MEWSLVSFNLMNTLHGIISPGKDGESLATGQVFACGCDTIIATVGVLYQLQMPVFFFCARKRRLISARSQRLSLRPPPHLKARDGRQRHCFYTPVHCEIFFPFFYFYNMFSCWWTESINRLGKFTVMSVSQIFYTILSSESNVLEQ